MKNVTIYSTPVCKYCGHAKEFFKENNIQYTEVNVAADRDQLAKMVEISGQRGVPVITIDNNVVIGYDEDALKHLLLPV